MMQFFEERHRDDLRANYRKVHDGGMGCCLAPMGGTRKRNRPHEKYNLSERRLERMVAPDLPTEILDAN